jgi:hypothetical protein
VRWIDRTKESKSSAGAERRANWQEKKRERTRENEGGYRTRNERERESQCESMVSLEKKKRSSFSEETSRIRKQVGKKGGKQGKV